MRSHKARIERSTGPVVIENECSTVKLFKYALKRIFQVIIENRTIVIGMCVPILPITRFVFRNFGELLKPIR